MFSIVMAAYNAEKYLRESIDSILNQTYVDFELLIVDDGSTDRTLSIAEEYAERDARVRVVAKKHSGFSDTRNTGLEAAQRDWIVVHDSDDIALPDRLAIYAERIRANPDVIAWGGMARFISSDGRWLHVSGTGPETRADFDALRARKEPVIFNDPTFAYRRDIALKVGGYTPCLIAADIDLMDRISDHGYMLLVPEVLTYYRVHGGSTTTTKFEDNAKSILYVYQRRAQQEPGKPALTYEEFEDWFASWSPHKKRRWQLSERSRQYWTSAGIAMGERRFAAFARDLILSGLSDPSWILNRARKMTRNALRLARPHSA